MKYKAKDIGNYSFHPDESYAPVSHKICSIRSQIIDEIIIRLEMDEQKREKKKNESNDTNRMQVRNTNTGKSKKA